MSTSTTFIHLPGIAFEEDMNGALMSDGYHAESFSVDELIELDQFWANAHLSRFFNLMGSPPVFLRFEEENARDEDGLEATWNECDIKATMLHLAIVAMLDVQVPPSPTTSIGYMRVDGNSGVDKLSDMLGMSNTELKLLPDYAALISLADQAVSNTGIHRSMGIYGRTLVFSNRPVAKLTEEDFKMVTGTARRWIAAGLNPTSPVFRPIQPLFLWSKTEAIDKFIELSATIVALENTLIDQPEKGKGIPVSMGEACANIVPHPDPDFYIKQFRKAYAVRSDFIHGRRKSDKWSLEDDTIHNFVKDMAKLLTKHEIVKSIGGKIDD